MAADISPLCNLWLLQESIHEQNVSPFVKALSLGEGEGESVKASVKYKFFLLNNDGSIGRDLDPDPNDSVTEAEINTGEKFVVRTLMADIRATPSGEFAAYHDLNFTNTDGSPAEKMELQWSDYNALKLGMPDLGGGVIATLSGTFKLQYGTERTAAIQVATRPSGNRVITDRTQTAANIQSAIEQLPNIGTGNVAVRVNTIDPALGYNFDITFRNGRARMNMLPPTIEETNFTVSSGGPPSPTISDIANPNPADASAARGALNYVFAGQTPLYTNGPFGTLGDIAGISGGRRMTALGGFVSSFFVSQPAEYFQIVDTAFQSKIAGNINIRGSVTPLAAGGSNYGIGLFNDGGGYLTASQIVFEDAVMRVLDRLVAVNDSAQVDENSAATLNVGSNDFEQNGLDFGIVAVTQPTNGAGTITFTNSGTAKSVLFTPTLNYSGPSTFTYTIRSSRGDQATATVTLLVLPSNDPPELTGAESNVSGDVLTTFTNAGTWSDPEGDAVTLSASLGTVTKNENGTWEWSFVPSQAFSNQSVTITGTDDKGASSQIQFSIDAFVAVVSSKVYYKGSSFANTSVDAALDPTKILAKSSASPQTLAFSNVINTTRGINGLVLDVAGLVASTLSPSDFTLRMSPLGAFSESANPPNSWANAPAPTAIVVTPGTATKPARVRIEWADNAIANRWLQIMLKSNANTGLMTQQVYYIGHLYGEVNGLVSNAAFSISIGDVTSLRPNVGSAATVSNPYDLDKSGTVSIGDITGMRPRVGIGSLRAIAIPPSGSTEEGEGAFPTRFLATPNNDLAGMDRRTARESPQPQEIKPRLADHVFSVLLVPTTSQDRAGAALPPFDAVLADDMEWSPGSSFNGYMPRPKPLSLDEYFLRIGASLAAYGDDRQP
jgi:hypothetical protein